MVRVTWAQLYTPYGRNDGMRTLLSVSLISTISTIIKTLPIISDISRCFIIYRKISQTQPDWISRDVFSPFHKEFVAIPPHCLQECRHPPLESFLPLFTQILLILRSCSSPASFLTQSSGLQAMPALPISDLQFNTRFYCDLCCVFCSDGFNLFSLFTYFI